MAIHGADKVLAEGQAKAKADAKPSSGFTKGEPLFSKVLPEHWRDNSPLPPEKKEFLDAQPYVVSAGQGAKCVRAVAYKILKMPTPPFDMQSIIAMNTGTMIHDAYTEAIHAAVTAGTHPEFSTVRDEVGVRTDDGFLVGFVDLDVEMQDDRLVVGEIKTTNPTSYAGRLGAFGIGGPQWAHVAQGSIYAYLRGADELRMIYLSQAPLGNRDRKNADNDYEIHGAEWVLTPDEFTPIALQAIDDLRAVNDKVEAGSLPAAKFHDYGIPRDHEVTSIAQGAWAQYADDETGELIKAGTSWNCSYCDYKPICKNIGTQEQPIELPKLTKIAETSIES